APRGLACRASGHLTQTPTCFPEPGEPPGLEEVPHGGHHQRVPLGAHHVLERGEQLIQGGREARRPYCHEFVRCHCRPLIRLHHMGHTVSSCRAWFPKTCRGCLVHFRQRTPCSCLLMSSSTGSVVSCQAEQALTLSVREADTT